MRFKHLNKATLLLLTAFRLSVSNAAQELSITDQAVVSPDVRRKLISEYESSTNGFVDDRLLAVAISYAVASNYANATPLYVYYLAKHPDNPRALRGLGTILAMQSKYDQAIGYLKTAWTLGDVDSLQPLAFCYLRIQKYDKMEGLLPALLEHKTNDLDIVNCLLAYALSKDPPRENIIMEALDGIPDKEIVSRSDTAQLVESAADRLKDLDANNKTLLTICKKAIRGYLADTNAWPKTALIGVGNSYFQLGDYAAAEAIYQQVLTIQPDNPQALAALGNVRLLQNRIPEAIVYLRKALALAEKRALAALSAAYLASQDFNGMQDLIPSLLERKGENMELLNSLLGYALAKTPVDRDLFYKAIQGVSDDQILRRPDTSDTVLKGLKLFGDEEHLKRLLKMKQEQDKGLKG